MEMLNRAIEDAADFKAFREALTKRSDLIRDEVNALREGENRAQRRARERAERKAAKQSKART